jgi:uncharacterized Fe-S cluster-containing MiaB family protein
VPLADDARIAEWVTSFGRVVVECHPRRVGPRALAFARRLSGRLEVAMGLETVHPEALTRLRKGMTLADYDRATATLTSAGIDHRAFVLVGAPFVPEVERVEWTLRSIDWAITRGARVVSLLPLRRGGPDLEPLFASGELAPPTLAEVEACLEPRVGDRNAVVQVDPWDLALLGSCAACAPARRERLARLSAQGAPVKIEPAVDCSRCAGRS